VSMKKKIELYVCFKKALFFLVPLFLWIWLSRDYLFGNIQLGRDARNFFNYANYYVYNIMHGVYPAWNPFSAWGRPNGLHLRTIGELNPFIHIMTVFNSIGVRPYASYMIYLVSYYFLGLMGFYLLARTMFNDKKWAYISVILLLFSSLSQIMFSDPAMILLFVETVWFFYFILEFTRAPSRWSFWGLVFVLMIAMTTYLPFYFLTIVLVWLCFYTVLYFKDLKVNLKIYFQFIKAHKLLFTIGTLFVLLSVTPGLIWYLGDGRGEYIVSGRQTGTMTVEMTMSSMSHGNYLGHIDLRQQLLGIDSRGISSLFVPIFSYLLIWLALWNVFNRRLSLFLMIGLFFVLLMAMDLSPVFPFLYKNVFYFRLFRNFHYFLWIAILPLFVLFTIEQLRLFSNINIKTTRDTVLFISFLFILHLIFAIILVYFTNHIATSYITIILSFVMFSLYFLGHEKLRRVAFYPILIFLFILQPLEVYSHISNYSIKDKALHQTRYPKTLNFSFTRPQGGKNEDREGNISFLKDESGFHDNFFRGSAWSFQLQKDVNEIILKPYVKYKFYTLTSIQNIEPDDFIHAASVVPIKSDDDQFRVQKFHANYLELYTNFKEKKFFIYNDSFYKGWQAFINGKKVDIVRTNIAFKGIWIPRGENKVEFVYQSILYYIFSWFMISCFIFAFIYLLWISKGILLKRVAV